MKYTVEDISPVEKKIVIELQKEEVEASIVATLALYGEQTTLPGFRKGTVPTSLIEQRFKKPVYAEARQDLINVQWQAVLTETKITPVGGLRVDNLSPFERNSDFSFSVTCEVLPELTLPNYEGLEVTVKKHHLAPNYLEEALKRMQQQHYIATPIEGNGPAKDGEMVNIDYAFFKGSKEIKRLSQSNFDLILGQRRSLPAFEEFIKSIPLGEERKEKIQFPKNFLGDEVRGEKILTRVKVNAIKRIELPELNDDFAKKLHFADMNALKEGLLKAGEENVANTERTAGKEELTNQLLKICDPPLMKCYVDSYLQDLVEREKRHFERRGIQPEADDVLKERFRTQAEYLARWQVLMLLIAKKEGLTVTDKDVQMHIYNTAKQMGYDYESYRKLYEESGDIFLLRDSMLADKAADLVYARAKVTVEDAAATTDEKAQNVPDVPDVTVQETSNEGASDESKTDEGKAAEENGQ